MIILDFAGRELQSIVEFETVGAASAELATGAGDAHVHFVDIAAGGEIGPHVANFGQLFVCLAGEGWVASSDDVRAPLRGGQAAYFGRGERHSKGSATGLRALIVQVRDLHLLASGVALPSMEGPLVEKLPPPLDAQIRAYQPSDHAEWLRMRRALWPEITTADEAKDAAEWLARRDTVVIVATRPNDTRLAGFAELGERQYAEGCDTSPVAYLEGWYVDEDLRRRGVGAALVRAGEAWARQAGYRELASDALLDNSTSHRAHLALGFAEVERAVRYCKAL